MVETALFGETGVSPELMKSMIALYPLGRIGQVSDISSTILFLASDSAAFITGSNILVEGGLVAGHSGANPTG